VINSCTVTAQADRKLRTMVHGLRRRHPQAHLILTGCHVDNPHPRLSAVPDADVAFPNARKSEIFDYVSANFAAGAAPGSTTFTRSRFFLKVQDGCNHRCTYCIVWRTRGTSRSGEEMDLIERARRAVSDGYGEIVLSGVDLGAFGRERGESLAPFLQRLLEAIAPARLRLSSINANDFTPELVELTGAPRFCRHLHIPLQSGSDRVLKRMGRLYRRRDYLGLVAALRRQSPEVAVTADVIVGFPGETDAILRIPRTSLRRRPLAVCTSFATHLARERPPPDLACPWTTRSARNGATDCRRRLRPSAERMRRASSTGSWR